MENSVKQYIISRVFTYCPDLVVKDNRSNNGFCAALPGILFSSIFEKLASIRAYLKRHHVVWYVSLDVFSGYDHEMLTIRFFDDVED